MNCVLPISTSSVLGASMRGHQSLAKSSATCCPHATVIISTAARISKDSDAS